MADIRRVPPGRAGRLWLQRRLTAAQRGVDLLDRKLRILRTERQQVQALARSAGDEWNTRCREADAWLTRAALLGGQREIRMCQARSRAEVTISWRELMGVRYPIAAALRPPETADDERPPGTAALTETTAAYSAALSAAVVAAAADEALHIIDAEVVATRRRLRALSDRWVPRLREAISALEQRLEESERGEAVRMRWSAAKAKE